MGKLSRASGSVFLLAACVAFRYSVVSSLRQETSDESQSFLRSEAGALGLALPQEADTKLSVKTAWVCRTSKIWGGCGSRDFESGGQLWQNASCPKNACCSKVACWVGKGCGSFCSDSFFNCPVGFLYHSQYSYGSCSCSAHPGSCDKNAVCVDVPGPGGGAFCHCKHGYVGDGKTCEPGGCSLEGDNCRPGSCVPLEGTSYTCKCPTGYKLTMREGRPFCVRKPCSEGVCGSGRCIVTRDGGHDCRCGRGSVKAFDGDQATCVPGGGGSLSTETR